MTIFIGHKDLKQNMLQLILIHENIGENELHNPLRTSLVAQLDCF